MNELKPCPFCGGENITFNDAEFYSYRTYARTYVYLKCETCGARTDAKGIRRKAIEAWNRRVKE